MIFQLVRNVPATWRNWTRQKQNLESQAKFQNYPID